MNRNKLSRRNFMQTAIWGIGGFIGLGYTVAAIAYVVKPSLKTQQTQTWMRLGPTSKVELGIPTLFTFTSRNPNRLDFEYRRGLCLRPVHRWAHIYCHVEYLHPFRLPYPLD